MSFDENGAGAGVVAGGKRGTSVWSGGTGLSVDRVKGKQRVESHVGKGGGVVPIGIQSLPGLGGGGAEHLHSGPVVLLDCEGKVKQRVPNVDEDAVTDPEELAKYDGVDAMEEERDAGRVKTGGGASGGADADDADKMDVDAGGGAGAGDDDDDDDDALAMLLADTEKQD